MLRKPLTWYSFKTSPGYSARYRLEIVCVNYTWSSVRRHGERHQNARLARTWIETSSSLACSTIWTRCSALRQLPTYGELPLTTAAEPFSIISLDVPPHGPAGKVGVSLATAKCTAPQRHDP